MPLKPYERCALLGLEIWIRWISTTIGTRWALSRRASDQQCDRTKTQRHACELLHWRGLAGELQLDAVPPARAKVPDKRNASCGTCIRNSRASCIGIERSTPLAFANRDQHHHHQRACRRQCHKEAQVMKIGSDSLTMSSRTLTRKSSAANIKYKCWQEPRNVDR